MPFRGKKVMLQVIKKERDKWGNVICHHIVFSNKKWHYKLINKGLCYHTHDITHYGGVQRWRGVASNASMALISAARRNGVSVADRF